MDKGLRNQIDRFYEEVNEGKSCDLGEMAVNLVHKMGYLIEGLEIENQRLVDRL